MYELVVNDKVQRENINSINYFRDDKLVQQAISDIIGNRISVLDRLHIKLEERKQKSQPQQQQQQERSRKS